VNASSNPRIQIDGRGIAWVAFDDPERKVNVLDEPVMRGLSDALAELGRLIAAHQVRAAVFSSAKADGFVAGADVDAILKVVDPREGEQLSRLGQGIFSELAGLGVPTVAAIHGLCLGGGTELALACRYRVASDSPSTKIGLPEVQLGILPAWGGTTRLPRLVGLQSALDLLLTGNSISASRAQKIGLVNEVFPASQFREKVADFAAAVADGTPPARKKRPLRRRLLDDTPPGRKLLLTAARRRVISRTGGHYPAPLRLLEVLQDGLGGSLERNLQLEAKAAGDLVASPESKNLIRVFHLREGSRKRTGIAPGTQPTRVDHMGVLGAGVMGGGIAQLAAYNGIQVRMKDIRHDAVASGLHHARTLFDEAVEKRRLKPREADQRMELISGGLEYDGIAGADLIVEAVVEKLEVKRKVLSEVEQNVGEHCILATNTSSLSIDAMAEALARPANLCGMHFFNPVHKMPLVEVVRGSRTSEVALATVHALAVRMGKVPVVVKDAPGFIVNRILGPYLNEGAWLLADGASIEDVDRAAKRFGMPMGPLRLIDEVGIDIASHAGRTLHDAFGERMAPAPALAQVAGTQRLGKKNGKGFYLYEGDKEQEPDATVYGELGLAEPGKAAELNEQQIRSRLVLAMVNEAARVLGDRVVTGAGDVDIAMIMGTGFPPFLGGPLRYADSLGPRKVLDQLKELEAAHGARFAPAPMLEELAKKGSSFYEAAPR
jgi:3-hydroxyacyl-CoA dehydrogenase / enoyl-CoA hydratase / 3-hydroxybutyryl-CoA epimerase